MPQEKTNRRVLSHDERANVEEIITKHIGEFFDEIGPVADNFSYTWDAEKSVLIAERYSDNGGAIEFYEVRPVVSYVGSGRYTDET